MGSGVRVEEDEELEEMRLWCSIEVEAKFNDEGGGDNESKRWDKRAIAGEDNAELVDDDDLLRLDDVGDG